MASQGYDRFRYAVCVQVLLCAGVLTRIVCLGSAGLFTQRLALLSAAAVLCAMAGARVGLRLLRRMSDRQVRNAILALLALLGAKYLAG